MSAACGCWDCRRARGETPSKHERPFHKADRMKGDGAQRIGTLYPGESAPGIPANADISGDDRRAA